MRFLFILILLRLKQWLYGDQRPYCPFVTFPNQSTFFPFSVSWMAMCVMPTVGAAPCQCFTPGGIHTTSPGRMSSIGPPQR